MKIDEYLLEYRDVAGDIVCDFPSYYRQYVKPLDPKFKYQNLTPTQLAICPLHDDHDPSLSLMKDRQHEGNYICHCFGCGQTANIIRFHQQIEYLWKGRKLTWEEAGLELCDLYGIPHPAEEDADDYSSQYVKKLKQIRVMRSKYTYRDYAKELLDMRKSGHINLDQLNLANIKIVATKKELYR